jgi:pimeloyl-ACP methyl ester carboxylesterase
VTVPREFYLGCAPDAVFSVYHRSAGSATPVLLCAPFGWEEVCAYRSIRFWADHLAAAGHPALRIDLPSTGESAGSPRDPGRLAAWKGAVGDAASWLARATGSPKVTVIGLGIGGILACLAADGGAAVGDLVLWGVNARGRRALRELRAFVLLRSEGAPGSAPAEQPDGSLEVGGFTLTQETQEALSAVDLTALGELGRDRRVLVLGRDGSDPDPKLVAHMEETGAEVRTDPGNGWTAMTDIPQDARPPMETIESVDAWLDEAPAPRLQAADPESVPTMLELGAGPDEVRETPMAVDQEFGAIRGVLVEPASRPAVRCAVFLNAGAMRRIGPNRLWVEASRDAAARGVACLRLDVEGLGDSDGDATEYTRRAALNVPELVAQVRAALDALEARGLPPRFTLIGLCSGGYQSFQSALEDERVRSACLINTGALFWHDSLIISRDAGKMRMLARPSTWARVLRGQIRPGRAVQLVKATWATRRSESSDSPAGAEVEAALDLLREGDQELLFAFSGDEPLHRELRQEGILGQLERWPNVRLETLPGAVHTLRPLEAQQGAREMIARLLTDAGEVPAPAGHAVSSG